jgi:protein Tex
MNDLSGIARHLRVSVDQIRKAADLLEQGYSPTFIEHYRGDETNSLPHALLWRLKFELDRRNRLDAARARALHQLPKDSSLDAEAENALAAAPSGHAIDVALRCFRARRSIEQAHDRTGLAGKLLEAMLSYDGAPIADLCDWVEKQVDPQEVNNLQQTESVGKQLLAQISRLVAQLIQGDTSLQGKLRHAIQRNAVIQVKEVMATSSDEATESAGISDDQATEAESSGLHGTEDSDAEDSDAEDSGSEDSGSEDSGSEDSGAEVSAGDEHAGDEHAGDEHAADEHALAPAAELIPVESPVIAAGDSATAHPETAPNESRSNVSSDTVSSDTVSSDTVSSDTGETSETKVAELKPTKLAKPTGAAGGGKPSSGSGKQNAKLTPRQRRRRWLNSVLAPMRSLKKPLHKLTAYQQLMLGRGTRSQLIATNLLYDQNLLVDLIRNAFTGQQHPLAAWFTDVANEALSGGLSARLEADAIAELEERAAESLLEHSADELRQQLTRRPVRGHTIALIDSVGPKTVTVAIVDSLGKVLACEELPCSAQAEIVGQSVIRMGEWIHKHRVTLVALTNGPARRFMVVTLKELIAQSKDSGLRWTMADRSGAEAYAGGRIGLSELSTYNRRQRAAIWVARCLQDPLVELLKVDVNRLRLGSYQRELPLEPMRQLIQETISDCVCERGLDTHHASEHELALIPGIGTSQAKQIAELARRGDLVDRGQLLADIQDWGDMEKRQAIAWLRVFGSPNSLDATLIHPEDYRLAQRLIEHTELTAPPDAPEGWAKRASPKTQAAEVDHGSDDAQPTESVATQTSEPSPAEMAEEISSEVSESTQSAEIGTESAEAGEQSAEAGAESGDAGTVSADAGAESGEAVAESNGDATESADAAPQATLPEPGGAEETANSDVALPAMEPEYPEDIVPNAPSSLMLDCEKLANQWQVGRSKFKMVASALEDPFRDPRLSGVPIPLMSEMPTLDNLQPDTCLWAVVVGVADFGVFVELGPNCNGLIHVSRLSSHFVEDPHQCVQIGDLLLTWVVNIDRKRNRVALTALSPAQREEMQAEAEARKAQAPERNRRGGFQRGHSQQDRSARSHSDAGRSPTPDSGAQGQRGRGGDREPAGAGQGRRPQRGHSGSQSQPDSGRQAGKRGRGGSRFERGHAKSGRGGDSSDRSSKSVVIQSKKPKAPITQAMKVGDEPLRSFSDLLQFYEAKRSDEVTESPPPPQSSPPPPSSSPPPPSDLPLSVPNPANEGASEPSLPSTSDRPEAQQSAEVPQEPPTAIESPELPQPQPEDSSTDKGTA